MATITIHPEHLDGLRALGRIEFERACEAQDVAQLRQVLDLEDMIAFDNDDPSTWDQPDEIRLADTLLERLITFAWGTGNERMGSFYSDRARGGDVSYDMGQLEREARSMLAFHEHMQGQKVAS